jgi:hypothetical protein
MTNRMAEGLKIVVALPVYQIAKLVADAKTRAEPRGR